MEKNFIVFQLISQEEFPIRSSLTDILINFLTYTIYVFHLRIIPFARKVSLTTTSTTSTTIPLRLSSMKAS